MASLIGPTWQTLTSEARALPQHRQASRIQVPSQVTPTGPPTWSLGCRIHMFLVKHASNQFLSSR